jgi:hypothetical protein
VLVEERGDLRITPAGDGNGAGEGVGGGFGVCWDDGGQVRPLASAVVHPTGRPKLTGPRFPSVKDSPRDNVEYGGCELTI